MHVLLGMTIQGVFSTTNVGIANMYRLIPSVMFIISALKAVLLFNMHCFVFYMESLLVLSFTFLK